MFTKRIIIFAILFLNFSFTLSAQKIKRVTSNGNNLYLVYEINLGSQNGIYIGNKTGMVVMSDTTSPWMEIPATAEMEGIYTYDYLAIKDSFMLMYGVGGLIISNDYGKTWKRPNTSVPKSFWITGIEYLGSNIFLSSNGYKLKGYMYKSNNGGMDWEMVEGGLPKGESIYGIKKVGQTLYASAGLLYSSSDNGLSWSKNMEELRMNNLATDGKTLFASRGSEKAELRGIYAMYEPGKWTSLRQPYARSITVNNSKIFAVTDEGIIRSMDSGKTWTVLNTGIDPKMKGYFSTEIHFAGSLVYIKANEELYVSGNDGLTWSRVDIGKKIAEMKVAKESDKKNTEVALQNYFSGIAEMEYKNFSTAEKKLSDAIKARPDFIKAIQARSDLYLNTGKLAESKMDQATIAQIKTVNPKFENTDVNNLIFNTEFLTLEGKVKDNSSSEHLAFYYKDDKGWYERGKKNVDTVAVECFTKAIELNNKKAEYFIARGDAYNAINMIEKATNDFNTAISLNPKCERYERKIEQLKFCYKCNGSGLGKFISISTPISQPDEMSKTRNVNGTYQYYDGGRLQTTSRTVQAMCEECIGKKTIRKTTQVKSVRIKE